MSADADDSYYLPPLNSPNLLKLGSSLTDKNTFLRSYIRSQEAHLASYAAEGTSGAASANPGTGKKTRTVLRDFEIESGFGTPILKHRTIARSTEPTSTETKKRRKSEDADSAMVAPNRVKHGDNAPQHKTATERRSRPKERAVDSNISITGQQQLDRFLTTRNDKGQAQRDTDKEKRGGPEASKRKHRDSNSDEEHHGRLAERRERRRAKQAVVAPKHKPLESDSGEDTDPQRKRGSRKIKKKTKKSKGLNMPAGLALMHGFSATNIGKNRLTVQLDPVVGVFNKGKASAKTAVRKSKPSKPYLKTFSEERFLSKARGHAKDNNANSDASNDPDQHHDHDHAESDGSAAISRAKPRIKHLALPQANPSKLKRARSPSDASRSSRDEEHNMRRGQDDHSPTRKSCKRGRAESPIWDIELEEGNLPSGSDADTSVASIAETKADGTVILDTHAAQAKWLSAAPQIEPRREEAVPTEDITPGDNRLETSSIAPSNSASQTASRRPNMGASGVPAFSKYFPVLDPPIFVPAASYGMPDIPSSPPVLQHTPSRHEGRSFVSDGPRCKGAAGDGYWPTSRVSAAVIVLPVAPAEDSLAAPRVAERSISPTAPSICYRSPLVSMSPLGILSGPPSPALSGFLARPARFDSPIFALARDRHHPSEVKPQPRRRTSHHTRRSSIPHHSSEYQTTHYVPQSTPDEFACSDGGTRSPRLDEPELAFPSVTPVLLCDLPPWAVRLQRRPPGSGDDDITELDVHAGFSEDYRDEYREVLPRYSNSVYSAGQDGLGSAHSGKDELLAYHNQPGVSGHAQDWCGGESHDDACSPDGAPSTYYDALPYCDSGEAVDDDVYCTEGSGDMAAEPRSDFVSDDLACDPELAHGAETFGDMAVTTDLEEDLGYESESDRSVLGSLQRFSQGRALLMGVSELGSGNDGLAGASKAEEDVAKSLKGHWQRQRF